MSAQRPDMMSGEELGRAVGAFAVHLGEQMREAFERSMSDLMAQVGNLSESVAKLDAAVRRTEFPDTFTPGHPAPGVPARTLAYALGQLAGQDKGRARTARGVPVPRTRN